MLIKRGNNNGNPSIATKEALLFALDTNPETNVNIAESPILPKNIPNKYCSGSAIIVLKSIQ